MKDGNRSDTKPQNLDCNASSDRSHSLTHLLIETLTLIAVIINIIIQINQQYKFKFFESKMETYVELVSVTGHLTVEENPKKFEELKKDFYALYWGKSQLFEGKDFIVKSAIIEFEKNLKKISFEDTINNRVKNFIILKESALNLANSCSKELKN